MGKELSEEYLTTAKESAAATKTLYAGLIGFALAIGVTLLVQTTETKEIERQRHQLEEEVSAPWDPMKTFYEGSRDVLDNYAKNESELWPRLFFVLSLEFINQIAKLKAQNKKGNLTILAKQKRFESELALLSGGINKSQEYNSHILKILYHQKVGTPFSSLPKDALHSLNYVLNFREDETKFSGAIEAATYSASRIYREMDKNGSLSKAQPSIRKAIEFGSNHNHTHFISATTVLLWQDMKSNGTYKPSENAMAILDRKIDGLSGENIGEVKSQISDLMRRSSDIKMKSTATIPIAQIEVPYSVFWIAGVIANSFLLINLYRLYGTVTDSLRRHAQLNNTSNSELYKVICQRLSIWPSNYFSICWSCITLLLPTILSTWVFSEKDLHPGGQILILIILALINVFMVFKILLRTNIMMSKFAVDS